MLDHRDRMCVPIEVEMLPLYRDPGAGRLRRRLRREARAQRAQRAHGARSLMPDRAPRGSFAALRTATRALRLAFSRSAGS